MIITGAQGGKLEEGIGKTMDPWKSMPVLLLSGVTLENVQVLHSHMKNDSIQMFIVD